MTVAGLKPASGAETLEQFLGRLASGAPAPGGGAAAALAGALAAALVGMVCRVTGRHDPSAGLAESLGPVDALRDELTRLVEDDARAYEQVLATRRLPAGRREAEGQAALEHATEVPARLARCSRAVLAACETVAPQARSSALVDLGVAASLARAALDSGTATARINLKELADARRAAAMEADLARLVSEGHALHERVANTLRARGVRSD